MKVRDVLNRVSILYHDLDWKRIRPDQYLMFLDDAILQTILVRPDAHDKRVKLLLTPGVRQRLPEEGLSLIDVYSNCFYTSGLVTGSPNVLIPANDSQYNDVPTPVRLDAGEQHMDKIWYSGKPVYEVARKDLDYFNNWYSTTPTNDSIDEFAFDVRTPKDFWVNPPVGTEREIYVEVGYSYSHEPFQDRSNNRPFDHVLYDPIDLNDAFRNALTSYVLYLCYSTDSTAQGDQAIAQNYLKSFFQSLQTDFASSLMANPRIIEPTAEGVGLHFPTPQQQEANS